MFTKQKILQILTIVIPRTEPSLWKKCHTKLASATIKQWSEKKLYNFVSPVLTLLWIAQGPLQSWSEALEYAFTTPNPVVKSAFWQWIIACATNDPGKAKDELKAVFNDATRFQVLLSDCNQKLVELRGIAIKCLACVLILAKNKSNIKALKAKYDENPKLLSKSIYTITIQLIVIDNQYCANFLQFCFFCFISLFDNSNMEEKKQWKQNKVLSS